MKKVFLFYLFSFLIFSAYAQQMTTDDYKKALWMTARMYGGQRSGEGPNWLIMDHTPSSKDMTLLQQAKGADLSKLQPGKCFTDDADGEYSLSGGWVDCGDHVKFGQTMFYAAYTLLKGYAEFPEGYDDYYSYDYNGYQSAGDFSWEGAKGAPNGIPDILDEAKYECDFLIKCARDGSTFYSQVGDGGPDHKNWVTSVAMATLPKSEGGQADGPRDFVKNPEDGSMPAVCAAALAVMARVYKPFDPAYADLCLTHAKYAYEYASKNQGKTVGAPTFYSYPNTSTVDDFVSASAELYFTTGDETYKNAALALAEDVNDHNYVYNYNNNEDVAFYNLALLGSQTGFDMLDQFVTMYKSKLNVQGVFNGGDSWGALRYPANASFAIGLWSKLNGKTTIDDFIYNNIGFILGDNNTNFSFVVGFERENCSNCTSSIHPHHRNVFLSDDIMADQGTMVIPERNRQFGYLIGGQLTVPYTESTTEYTQSEGGIDYNAGLVSALGYINSVLAPIDLNKFGHPTPEVPEEVSLCGKGSATITATVDLANLEPGESVSLEWYKEGDSSPFETGVDEVTVTEAGTYICKLVENSDAWATEASTVVTDVLPVIDLGDDFVLCTPAYRQIDAEITGEGLSYVWQKDGEKVADGSIYTIYEPGTYTVVLSANGCASTESSVTVTSIMPNAINDVLCSAGNSNIGVDATEGVYEWYDSESGGTALHTGFTYSPSVSENTAFYVKDISSIEVAVGPSATNNSLSTGSNVGSIGLNFDASKAFEIVSLVVSPFVYGCNPGDKVQIDFDLNDANGTTIGTYSTLGVDCEGLSGSSPLAYYTLVFETPVSVPEAGSYTLIPSGGNQLVWFQAGADYSSYKYDGLIQITGDTRSDESNSFPGIYDITVSTGKDCALQPVFVTIDPASTDCNQSGGESVTLSLNKGWNLISLPLQLDDMSVESVFSGLPVEVVKDFDSFYDFNQEPFLSTLTELEMGKGYLVKLSSAADLTLEGTIAENVSVELSSGWNLIGYPSSGSADLTTVLSGIQSSIETVKTFDASYIGEGGTNTLTKLSEGQGYFIKLTSGKVLNF